MYPTRNITDQILNAAKMCSIVWCCGVWVECCWMAVFSNDEISIIVLSDG
jgi:hypothetical protein